MPREFYSELDERRYERRKIEIFADGRVGIAPTHRPREKTQLGLEPVPSLFDIQKQGEFQTREITAAEFEKKWSEVTAKQ
jgi:hypothetical protein